MDGKRLAAVLFSDMHGYSRQMDDDEQGTLEKLARHNAIFEARIAEQGGRTIKTIGDAFMVELPSALAAVECALGVLADLARHNEGRPEGEHIAVRLGVHVGDVTEQGGDLFGETVNIAARLEPLAPVGGLCVTAAVFQQIRRKVRASIAWREVRELKNLRAPLLLYGLVPGEALLEDDAGETKTRSAASGRRWGLAGALSLAATLILWVGGARMQETEPEVDAAALEAIAAAQAMLSVNTKEAVDRAVGKLEHAVELAPDHAPAWLALSDAYLMYAGWGLAEAREKVPLARRAAQKALTLEPDLAEAHLKLGDLASMYDWEWEAAEEHFRKASALDPTHQRAKVTLAWLFTYEGRFREATALVDEVVAGLPEGEPPGRGIASVYVFSAETHARGEAMLLRLLEQDPRSIPVLDSLVVGAMCQRGQLEKALAWAEKLEEAWHGRPYTELMLALIHAALGHQDEARKRLERLEVLSKEETVARTGLAQVWLELGEPERALALLEEAHANREFHLVWLRILPFTARTLDDPEWKALRDQDGYWRLMDRMGFPPFPPEHPGYPEEQAWLARKAGRESNPGGER
ncbi:MAG: adenylate/guanylate cyclase domain-containing protein [Deltaproteobacteria bacterium]|nr:adenylate/guanylate cyclase domain-containing protein [Deltaproteobacteria bacterium]